MVVVISFGTCGFRVFVGWGFCFLRVVLVVYGSLRWVFGLWVFEFAGSGICSWWGLCLWGLVLEFQGFAVGTGVCGVVMLALAFEVCEIGGLRFW